MNLLGMPMPFKTLEVVKLTNVGKYRSFKVLLPRLYRKINILPLNISP
jgi:hypothetical protein